ncbi:MAG TPA: hypothetical protein VFT90_18935 [Chryseosolibacter sp.]|nr:hypothetical protein [Chryseosolibacter sp.]
MMRILMAISLISLALACAHKDAGKGRVKVSNRTNPGNQPAEELQSDIAADSTFYVGYVDYFPETREFYTALFHRDGHEYPDEDLLESRLDSVIISDEDWGRERLPMEEARRMLMLSGLDTLTIFNRKHEQVCRCPLTRVEYLWNGMESYFIAVFKSDLKSFEQTEELYGISGHFPLAGRTLFSAEELADESYNEYVKKQLQFSNNLEWDMRHYRIEPHRSTYSVISSYSPATSEVMSYLALQENDAVHILNEEMNNFQYLNILPVPIHMNGRPLLLISAGYPSSDVLWDYLAGFDGTRYDAIDYNRIHIKNISAQGTGVVLRTASIE